MGDDRPKPPAPYETWLDCVLDRWSWWPPSNMIVGEAQAYACTELDELRAEIQKLRPVRGPTRDQMTAAPPTGVTEHAERAYREGPPW